MDIVSYKTVSANKSTVEKKWHIVDAGDAPLGRLCSEVAKILRGKHKPSFTPHVDCGDKVIIVNADSLRLTGKKIDAKEYIRHTGYPGGQRFSTPREEMEKSSTRVIEKAIKGMLPKNSLGREVFKNLHIYEGSEHPHEAQQPQKLDLSHL
ncbi:large subunit ribosomal protein L13 [Catalinimonas alkaloidigena]|uniref:50S ribosomal protein L13 n=1 Tax=Catalinimonas alkaloidigena TaxID=1075417 RepID=UPI0024060C7A|nr:50S ribosomal protein L13 [Catalinimonas alkaloidigena]MDF9798646.1 large subunit ribosomal protein L13 [Catalinimonas alkaloidigena]